MIMSNVFECYNKMEQAGETDGQKVYSGTYVSIPACGPGSADLFLFAQMDLGKEMTKFNVVHHLS